MMWKTSKIFSCFLLHLCKKNILHWNYDMWKKDGKINFSNHNFSFEYSTYLVFSLFPIFVNLWWFYWFSIYLFFLKLILQCQKLLDSFCCVKVYAFTYLFFLNLELFSSEENFCSHFKAKKICLPRRVHSD